jgi:hypothetical protein
MKFKMIKEGNVYYPLVERKPLFGLLGTYWDYIFPDGWSSGQMMHFYTEEDAEECIRYNESIGNHVERCYEVGPKKNKKNRKGR